MCELAVERDNGIAEDGEIGSRAVIEMRGSGGGEVAAGGETHDADTVGCDVDACGAFADHANRLLRVIEHGGMVVARAESILEHERGHAEAVEPLRELRTFLVDRERAIAAAGADDDGGPVGRTRKVGGERGAILLLLANGTGCALRPERLGGRRRGGLGGEGGKRKKERLVKKVLEFKNGPGGSSPGRR